MSKSTTRNVSKKVEKKKARTRGRPLGHHPASNVRKGVVKPRKGTIMATIWDVCDKLREEKKRTPTRQEVLLALNVTHPEYNPSTVSVTLHMWRKFYGVKH